MNLVHKLYAAQGERLDKKPAQEECLQCHEMHDPHVYLGRGRWLCSEKCLEEWMQWGRYEREYEDDQD